MAKQYIVVSRRNGRTTQSDPSTIKELVDMYKYTLDVGASYQHERGNKKINVNPKTSASLETALNKAVNNAAANGCSQTFYKCMEYKQID